MNAKVRKKRFWAAVLCIAAVFVMSAGGLGGSNLLPVYAAEDDNIIKAEPDIRNIAFGSGRKITLSLNQWNNNTDPNASSGWSPIDNDSNHAEWKYNQEVVDLINKNENSVNGKVQAEITGKNVGTAEIYVEQDVTSITPPYTRESNKITIYVNALNIIDEQITIGIGETYTLTAEITPYGSVDNNKIEWTSNANTIVSAEGSGNTCMVKGLNTASNPVTITASVTFSEGNTITDTCTVNIDPNKTRITTPSPLPTADVGTLYSQTLEATSVANDTYKWTSSNLPAWLSLNENTGVLSGTPPTTGNYTFSITAISNKNNGSSTKVFTLSVGNRKVIFTPQSNDNFVTLREQPANLETIANTRINAYNNYYGLFGGINNYKLYFPVLVKAQNDSDISGKAKIDAAIKAVKDKATVHYVDITPYETFNVSGNPVRENITDMGSVVAIPFDVVTSDTNFVVLRYHNGDLYPMARLSPVQLNGLSEGYYYAGGGRLYIHSRYYSTFAIVHSSANIITVGFNSNGGSHVDPVVITAGGTISEPTKSTRSGYTFEGWYMDEGLRTKWTTGTTFNSDWILNANWTQSNSGATNSGNSGTSGSTSGSGGGTTNRGTNPSGTTPVNAPQTGDPIDYVRAFAAIIVICAGTLVLLYTLKARRRK